MKTTIDPPDELLIAAKKRAAELVEDEGAQLWLPGRRRSGGDCRRNVPAAELRAIPSPRRRRRPIGLARGLQVPSSFFEPLPAEVVAGFDGR